MSTPTSTSARDRSFRRKIFYLIAMVPLLMLLFWLSHPATRDSREAKGRPGGKLAELREKHQLNQTELGQIDPTSETIKLATLGLRGVAVGVLWHKANDYQMKKDWTNLRATLEQISKLQPHSIGVWRYQAWNLSYNVSVAFDDYRDKYYWVIEGIKFLQKGAQNNEHEPRLYRDLGWFISHKIGRADEARLYRKLFQEDDQFHGSRSPDARDNWLVGKQYYREAEERDDGQHPLGVASVIFYSEAPLCQFSYADALEKDGRFGQKAPAAWRQAGLDWHEFGQIELPTTNDAQICLNDQEKYEKATAVAAAALDKLAPGLREKIFQERLEELTPAERKAWNTPANKRTEAQNSMMMAIESRLQVNHDEVARRVTDKHRAAAKKLAEEANHNQERALQIRAERSIVNFDFWRLRAEVEQTPEALAARQEIYNAAQAFRRADLIAAREGYEKGLQSWRKLLDRFPKMKEDINTGQDLVQVSNGYRACLKQLGKPFPKPFILQDVLDKYENK